MFTRYLLPALAIIGLVFALFFTQTHGKKPEKEPNQLSIPPATPFERTVSGTGMVEANTRNISIGSHVSGVIATMHVTEGQQVQKGAPLFTLDERSANAQVERLKKDIAAAAARVENVRISLADENDKLARAEKLKAGTSISVDMLQRRRFGAKGASAALKQEQAVLASARARLKEAEVLRNKLTVTAPVSGEILKINMHPGEYLNTVSSGAAPLIMGGTTPLHLRVSIDENDVWRFSEATKATATLRSNNDINFELEFVRIEPFVQPKQNLNGDSSQRVDTRILEILYRFNRGEQPIYIGQQMDVFIESKE